MKGLETIKSLMQSKKIIWLTLTRECDARPLTISGASEERLRTRTGRYISRKTGEASCTSNTCRGNRTVSVLKSGSSTMELL